MPNSATATLDANDETLTISLNGLSKPLVSARFFLSNTSATTAVVKVRARPRGQSAYINLGWLNLQTMAMVASGNQSLTDSTDYIISVPDLAWADSVQLYLVSIASGSYAGTAFALDADETRDLEYSFPVVNSAVANTITSTSATALAVGANGTTNPVFSVNANTASVATGLTVIGAAAAAGVALTVISSGTNEPLFINAKGSGVLTLNTTATGQIYMSRGAKKVEVMGRTVTALGTLQSSTPTIAELLTGIVTQTSSTGAGTVTLPTGTAISAGMPLTPATGDTFETTFCNLGGGQTLTITGATGSTVVGEAAVATATGRKLVFTCTGSNAWTVVCC